MKLLAILCIRDETILQYIYIDILQYLLASYTGIQQLPYMALLHILMYYVLIYPVMMGLAT